MGKTGARPLRGLYPVLEFSITLITWHRLRNLTLRNLPGPGALSGYLEYSDVTPAPRELKTHRGELFSATGQHARNTVVPPLRRRALAYSPPR